MLYGVHVSRWLTEEAKGIEMSIVKEEEHALGIDETSRAAQVMKKPFLP